MHKYFITVVIGMVFMSGCASSRFYDSRSPIEVEQYENPMIWKEMLKTQVTLWPLEKKVNLMEKSLGEIQKSVNEMRDELAATKTSSAQVNKTMESPPAENPQIKYESAGSEIAVVELPAETSDKRETQKAVTNRVAEEGKKANRDIPSLTVRDIEYSKVSDTQDRVLIYVNAMNNPKLQMLTGENPRIVLDFLNARGFDKGKNEISIDGNFVKKIRIWAHKGPTQKVRVVFDMLPDKNYAVDQKFLKKENIYSFDIKAKM